MNQRVTAGILAVNWYSFDWIFETGTAEFNSYHYRPP